MNILRSLFAENFPKVIESVREFELHNGRAFLLILREMIHEDVINLPGNARTSVEEALVKGLGTAGEEGKENWALFQRVMKVAGFNLEPFVTKYVQTKRSVELQIFIYEFYNVYRRLKDSPLGSGLVPKGPSPSLDLHNGIHSIDQCAQLFEKLVFLVSKAAKIRLLEVT
jgi:hypothetical protein